MRKPERNAIIQAKLNQSFTNLPTDVHCSIYSFFAPRDAARLAVTNKAFRASTFEHHELYAALVRGQRIFNQLPTEEIEQDFLWATLNHYCIYALGKQLITLEQLRAWPAIPCLINANGIAALEEKLLSFDQAQAVEEKNGGLSNLLSDNGLQALREGMLIPALVLKMDMRQLSRLTRKYGFQALQEKLVTAEQIPDIDSRHLSYVFSEVGLFALRQRMIRLEQISQLPEDYFINFAKHLKTTMGEAAPRYFPAVDENTGVTPKLKSCPF